MGSEEHVTRRARRGYALAAAVALIFLMAAVLGAAVSHLDYSFGVMKAWLDRVEARNELESMTNLSLKWLSSELKKGKCLRVACKLEQLTDRDSLRIFALKERDCEAEIYDLDYAVCKINKPIDVSGMFPPSFPGGYMIRATVKKQGMAPLTLESVYTVISEDAVETLDDDPVYSREYFVTD